MAKRRPTGWPDAVGSGPPRWGTWRPGPLSRPGHEGGFGPNSGPFRQRKGPFLRPLAGMGATPRQGTGTAGQVFPVDGYGTEDPGVRGRGSIGRPTALAAGVVAAGLLVAGCTGVNHVVATYGSVPAETVTMPGGATFRVFDRPQLGRIMTAPSLRQAATSGAVASATFGLVDPSPNPVHHRQAAEYYLAASGRTCVLEGGSREVLPTQYEHLYSCRPSSPVR